MNVTQCDNCKRLGPSPPPPTWPIILTLPEPQNSLLSYIGVSAGNPDPAVTFCSWRCVGEYAIAKALIEDVKPGELP